MSSHPIPASHADLGLMVGFPPPPNRRVTRENGLWTPPYNRWANQNMRRLMPTAGWPPAADPVRLASRPHDLGDLATNRIDGSETKLDEFLVETYTDAFVVVQDGAIVHERYFNGMTPSSPYQMMSCGKSFVGLFALAAAVGGALSEQSRFGDLVEELDTGGAFADATFGQVLDMTNSMAFNEDYQDPAADIHAYARVAGLGPGTDEPVRHRDLHEFLAALAVETGRPHGAVFHYQGPKTDAVNWATNRHTGRSLVDDLARLWQAFGGGDEAYMMLDPAGTALAAGGLSASPHDLARFAVMITDGGRLAGRQVLDPSVIAALAAGGSADAFLAGPEAQGFMADGDWTFRAHWWIRHTPGREALVTLGTSGQWIYCDLERRLAVIRQASFPKALDLDHDAAVLAAIDRIADALC